MAIFDNINPTLLKKMNDSQNNGANAENKTTNKNLFINSNFASPINQRGKDTYTSSSKATYTIDRWYVTGATTRKVTVCDGYVEVSNTSGSCYINQPMDNVKHSDGKTYTMSANINGNVRAFTFVNDGESKTETFDDGTQLIIENSQTNGLLKPAIGFSTGTSAKIYWAKIEEGSVATPYIAKEYYEELLICSLYYTRTSKIEYGQNISYSDREIY